MIAIPRLLRVLSKVSWGAVGWQDTGHSSALIAIPRLLQVVAKVFWGAVGWQHAGPLYK